MLTGLFMFSSCEKEVELNENAANLQGSTRMCPTATFTVSPCDMGFRVFALFNGQPTGFTYYYSIAETATGTVVDSGPILNAQYTNPYLSYCTQYTITLYDPCTPIPTVITAYSDGCNNIWVC
jgi:hypothetical protein